MQKEVIIKFGSGIEQSCLKINFDASVEGGMLQVENKGDITIGAVNVYHEFKGSINSIAGITSPIMPGEAAQSLLVAFQGINETGSRITRNIKENRE